MKRAPKDTETKIARTAIDLNKAFIALARSNGFGFNAKSAGRPIELVHRAIPYPVLLVAAQTETASVSLAHKRFARNEAEKVVLDGPVTACAVDGHPAVSPFLASLSLATRPKTHLLALYQGWANAVEALLAARIAGEFSRPSDSEMAEARHEALAEHDRLTRDIAGLRAQAAHVSQMNRRVELNLEIKRLEALLAEVRVNP